jgi:hypothetical protein
VRPDSGGDEDAVEARSAIDEAMLLAAANDDDDLTVAEERHLDALAMALDPPTTDV